MVIIWYSAKALTGSERQAAIVSHNASYESVLRTRRMNLTRSRRVFLAAMGLASLTGIAGCVDGSESSRGATDVILYNDAKVSRTVEVTVTQRDGESSNSDTRLDMSPHSRQKINNKGIMDSDYDVNVTFTDETGESPYSETQEWNDAGPPLHIILTDQIIFAVQIG